MTVGELKRILSNFLDKTEVQVFAPFDSEGPCTWETPIVYYDEKLDKVRVTP